ncbi:L,D-transpeptidase [Patescibacteria group bacterium]
MNYPHPGPFRIILAICASIVLFGGLSMAVSTASAHASEIVGTESESTALINEGFTSPTVDEIVDVTIQASATIEVESITPSGGKVWPNTPIIVKFTTDVDQAMAEMKIHVAPRVSGIYEWIDGRTVRFWPWMQGNNMRYSVQVTAGVPSLGDPNVKTTQEALIYYIAKDLPGDSRIFRVAITNPHPNTTVGVNQPIKIVFSHPVDRAAAQARLHVAPHKGGTFTWPDDNTMIYTPNAQKAGYRYSYQVTAGIPWLANNAVVTKSGVLFYYKTFSGYFSASGKRIIIDLSQQRIYAYEGSKLMFSNLVSTGLPGTPTPVGTFRIRRKVAVMAYVAPTYYLPNTHWNSEFHRTYAGGYYIHEAWWHNNFGHPMSHGCVNMTYSGSKYIYYWAPIGTPVYIRR